MVKILEAAWFARDAREVAPALLGKVLCVRGGDGVVRRGRLVEVEAYLAEGDGAAHGARGMTKAKASLFGPAGRLYVHPMRQWCGVDIVCGDVGVPTSVLLRGIIGERDTANGERIDGPGKLTRALGITRAWDGMAVASGPIEGGVVLHTPTGRWPEISPEASGNLSPAKRAKVSGFGYACLRSASARGDGCAVWVEDDGLVVDVAKVRVGPRVGITQSAALPLRWRLV